MLPDSNNYVQKKSKRLAILTKEKQILVDTTLQKPSQIIQMFEEALYSLVGDSIKVSTPNDEFQLSEWEYDCPAAPAVFWKYVKEVIQDIVTYTPQLGMAQEFHSKNIKLLLAAVTKHFLLHSEYTFQKSDLELRTYISKALKILTVPINKEPH